MNAGKRADGAALLEVRDLRVEHPGGVVAVDGVSFSLDAGRTLGILGPSGCGKSSLLGAILGLLPRGSRTSGEVRWQGLRIDDLPPARLRALRGAEIAMVYQEPDLALHPARTVGGQIGEVLRAHGRGGAAARRTRALELLTEMDFEDPAAIFGAFPHQLSGGQRRRVVLAQALACEPRLLLADEPTAALDLIVQIRVLEQLAKLREQRGLAMILVSHDPDLVRRISDRVVSMRSGVLLEGKASRDAVQAGVPNAGGAS